MYERSHAGRHSARQAYLHVKHTHPCFILFSILPFPSRHTALTRPVQVTGCLDPSKSTLDPSDAGGQLDVRFPNGAQCTFGGYGASFIELCVYSHLSSLRSDWRLHARLPLRSVEPALNRFCLRCCRDKNDQKNCNSHRDRMGCENAVPGTYDFPELGVRCA
jgi:hypothetical protein